MSEESENDKDKENSKDQSHSEEEKEITPRPEINKDDLLNKLNNYFALSELKNLETYYAKRDEDINSIMFALYDHTKAVETIKFQMPIVKPTQVFKFIKKRDDELSGGSSTMSRRSNSSTSSRKFGGGFGTTKMPTTKFGAQKVSINIGGDDLNNSTMRKTVSKSIDPKLSSLKNNLIGGNNNNANNVNNVSKSHENMFSADNKKNQLQAKLTASKEKQSKQIEVTKGLIDSAKNNNNIIKKLPTPRKNGNGSNLPTSESIDKESGSKTKSAKPIIVKPNSLVKKSEIINKIKGNTNQIVNTNTNANVENPKNFKFEPKKKQTSMLTGAKAESDIKVIDDNQHLRSNSENTRYKNVNNLNNIVQNSNYKTRMQQFLNDFNNLPQFINIFKFLNTNDKIIFKNTNKTLHKCFFENEILELERVIFEKKKEDNPLYNMILSNELQQKVSYSKAFLSENLGTLQGNQNFKNFIDMLYVFLFTSGGNGIIYLIKTKSVAEKVKEIEEFISKIDKNSNKNIYSIFNECYNNLTKNKEIYNTLKYLFDNNKTIFDIHGLPDEFTNFLSLIDSLKEHINMGQNMETIIDLEILSHKLDKLKSFTELS